MLDIITDREKMRERLTAIIAIILLLILIAASYWYAMQASFSNLRYIPSENSPDFIASEATIISFDEQGVAKTRLKAQEFAHYSNDTITNGVLNANSFRLIGPQATILGEGTFDLNNLTQNIKMTVLPDISLGGASLALAVANPLLGVGSFIAQLALQNPLSELLSTEYMITGSLDEPIITKLGEDETAKPSAPSH